MKREKKIESFPSNELAINFPAACGGWKKSNELLVASRTEQ
jgi:hypothetical protein